MSNVRVFTFWVVDIDSLDDLLQFIDAHKKLKKENEELRRCATIYVDTLKLDTIFFEGLLNLLSEKNAILLRATYANVYDSQKMKVDLGKEIAYVQSFVDKLDILKKLLEDK